MEGDREVDHTTTPQPAGPLSACLISWEEEDEQEEVDHTTTSQQAAQHRLLSDHQISREEEEEVDHTTNLPPAAQHGPHGLTSAFFLYCKTDVDEDSLVGLTAILANYGILSCIDITTEQIPANWSLWTEKKIESCHYVILVCTEPLYRALKNHVSDDLVEMFKGKFFACAVVNHVRAPKFIPVFIDCTPDEKVVPSQLKTHHFYYLRVRELGQAVEGKSDEDLDREIKDNPLFMDIKQLIDLLQQQHESWC